MAPAKRKKTEQESKLAMLQRLAKTPLTLEEIIKEVGCSRRYASKIVYPIRKARGMEVPGEGRPHVLDGIAVPRMVIITQEQKKYIDRNIENFSDWVRQKVNKEIEASGHSNGSVKHGRRKSKRES